MTRVAVFAWLSRVQQVVLRVERGMLVALLLTMIGVAALQIVLRNFFGFGIIWAESLTRMLVLWTALMGAMLASRTGRHIRIDALSNLLPDHARFAVKALVELFTVAICLLAAWYSLQFVLLEYADGGMAFAQVPNWVAAAMMPVSFLVIALRYLSACLLHLIQTWR